MSRSNGPLTGGGGQQQDWQHASEPDPSAQHVETPPHHPYQWPQHSQQQAHYGYAPAAPQQPGYAEPQQSEPHYPPYHYPQDAGGGQPPFSTPVQHPPFFGPQPAAHQHAPAPYPFQLDHHPDAQQPPGGAHYRHHEAAAPLDHQAYASRPEHHPDRGLAQLQPAPQHRQAHTSLRDQLRKAQYDQWPAGHDPRDYDLGSYMPTGAAGQPAYGEPAAPSHGGQFDPHWQDPLAYAADPQGGAGAYYAQLGGESLPVAGHGQGPDDADADDADYEYEEAGRGRRGLLIAVALVGAIAVGGGLAYGYKAIIGPSPKGTPPVIKADMRPAKSQPADPGGKQFAHSDSKLLGRLEAEGGSADSAQQAAGDTDASGVRRVPTIVVSRDGTISPPAAEPRLPPPTVSVPGMTIVDGFGGRATPAAAPAPRTVEPASPAAPPPPAQIIAKAAPQPPAPRAEPESPVPVRSAVVQPQATPAAKPAVVRQAAVAPKTNAASAGYVAVLSSQRSRMDALKTFADLQQKYVGVLQNKIPDVQEADLSARGLGTMYRVVVGPPSSREAANDLCGQLKSAGFQGCWITTY